jgi:hypothetical protein
MSRNSWLIRYEKSEYLENGRLTNKISASKSARAIRMRVFLK